jgi:hypothetical protein
MKGYFLLCFLPLFVFGSCRKKESGVELAHSNTLSPPAIQIYPVDSATRPATRYFNGDFRLYSGVTGFSDSVYKNTVFSLRYVSADSFVIATPNYLPYELYSHSDSLIYGFRKNNTGNYQRHFGNNYGVSLTLVLVNDSAYVHIQQMISCPDGVDTYFAGKSRN